MKVLIVEDSPTMRRVISGVVLRAFPNFEIFEAEDGTDALDILKLEEISLVLCDWILPKLTGLDLVRAMRAIDRTKDIPFIMISTKGMKSDIINAIKSGVNDYCAKPIDPPVLENKIKNILNTVSLEKEEEVE